MTFICHSLAVASEYLSTFGFLRGSLYFVISLQFLQVARALHCLFPLFLLNWGSLEAGISMKVPGISPRLAFSQMLVAFFTVFSLVLVLLRDPRFSSRLGLQDIAPYYGVVLSMNPERFNHTQHLLVPLGFRVEQRLPPRWDSEELSKSLEAYVGSRVLHNPTNLKIWSCARGNFDGMRAFVEEALTTTPNAWRFFFEDDLGLHPDVTVEHAKALIAKGLELADEDGFFYLGICGPTCEDSVMVENVEMKRCSGMCTHAYAFKAKEAAKFLQQMSCVKVSNFQKCFIPDELLKEYANQGRKVWVVGSNLRSPQEWDHYGILFQDRKRFSSSIA